MSTIKTKPRQAVPPPATGSANHGQEPPAERTSDAVRSGVGGEPRLVITSTPLDLELCELLGEKPSDFVVTLANGKSFGYGTPYDSPNARSNADYICARLNDDGKDSWWPEFSKNWANRLAEVCPPDSRPVFTWELHRVCAGHSSYVHCAIRLLDEHLKGRVTWWCVGSALGNGKAELVMNDRYYIEEDSDLALAIGRAVARALREAGGGGAELGANVETGESKSGAGSPSIVLSNPEVHK